jgi:GGDEF domain-containing protein
LRPDGSTAWVHDRSKLVRDADGYPMFVQGVMFDITAQKEAELRISHLAYHDALTDLPNRVMFDEHLHLELGGEGELARAAVDLVVGRIMEALGEPAILAGSEVSTAGTVGSAIYPFDGEDRRALLMCADASMYALKRDARLAG